MTFPAPQTSSSIDPVAQTERQIWRSDPGASMARTAADRQSCSTIDAQGRELCIRTRPASQEEKRQASASTRAVSNDLVPWCADKPNGTDYMNRFEACLKSVGSADLIFLSSDKDDPPLGVATFYFEQRIKTYPNRVRAAVTLPSSTSSSS
ncbi:hypothetical protein GCM10010129_79680 [Streptomyces fumigatiscleroticus]|nr:hypothetical protein GCM10010129_79680 [Streptomyces fumigatiscleroticus]